MLLVKVVLVAKIDPGAATFTAPPSAFTETLPVKVSSVRRTGPAVPTAPPSCWDRLAVKVVPEIVVLTPER